MDSFEFDKEHQKYIDRIVKRYEKSIKDNVSLFFDSEDFEALIDFYQSSRDYTKALSVVNQALAQYPFSSALLIDKAQILAEVKRFDEAIRILDKVALTDSTELEIYLTKADILTYQSKYHAAIKVLKDRIPHEEQEDVVFLYLQIADIYESWDKYDKAFEWLQKSLELDPDNEEALGRLNYCAKITEDYEESIRFHERYINNNPYSVFAWCNLSSAYAGLEKYDEAIDNLKYALAIDDEFEFIYHDLVDLYLLKDEPETALEVVGDYEEKFGYDEFSFILNAECYRAMDNFKMAKYYYKRALSINSNLASVYYELGKIYEEEEEWQLSLAYLQKATELEEFNYDYLIDAAKVAQEIDDDEKALHYVKEAILLDEKRFEAYLIFAQTYLNLYEVSNALNILEKGIQLCEDKVELRFAHISVLHFFGYEKEAVNLLVLLMEEKPERVNDMLDILPDLKNHPEIIRFFK